MKKKVFALAAVPTLMMGMLAGCGPKEEAEKPAENTGTDKPKELVLWEDKDKSKGIENAIKKFEDETGIDVKIKEMTIVDQVQKLRLDGPAGTGPDVFVMPHDQVGGAVTEGLVAELNVTDDVKKTFTESGLMAETFEGKLYGLPKAIETPVLVYNKKLVSEEEIPKTMEELQKLTIEKNKKNEYFFLGKYDDFYHTHGLITTPGGYVFKNNDGTLDVNDIGLNNEGSAKGAAFVKEFYKSGAFPTGLIGEQGGQFMDQMFTEGKAAIIQTGPWNFQPFKDAGIDLGVMPLPTLDGKPVQNYMGVKGYHVSAFSKNQEWATKLLESITNAEAGVERFEKTQEVTPNVDVIASEAVKADNGASAVAEQSKSSVPMPNVPEVGETWVPMADALALIANDKMDVQKALDEAVKQIKVSIETNHKK